MNKTFKLGAVALASALALAACKQEVKSADAASGTQTASAAASELGTPAQQASYAMGVDIGRSLKQIHADIDSAAKTVCKAVGSSDFRTCVDKASRNAKTQLRDMQVASIGEFAAR